MNTETILIILGMAIVTYIPRVLPIISLSKIPLPRIVLRWLSFIPVAVLSSLLLPSILVTDGKLNFGLENSFLFASIPAFVVAYWRRSLLLTVVVGMMSLVLINRFL